MINLKRQLVDSPKLKSRDTSTRRFENIYDLSNF